MIYTVSKFKIDNIQVWISIYKIIYIFSKIEIENIMVGSQFIRGFTQCVANHGFTLTLFATTCSKFEIDNIQVWISIYKIIYTVSRFES